MLMLSWGGLLVRTRSTVYISTECAPKQTSMEPHETYSSLLNSSQGKGYSMLLGAHCQPHFNKIEAIPTGRESEGRACLQADMVAQIV